MQPNRLTYYHILIIFHSDSFSWHIEPIEKAEVSIENRVAS